MLQKYTIYCLCELWLLWAGIFLIHLAVAFSNAVADRHTGLIRTNTIAGLAQTHLNWQSQTTVANTFFHRVLWIKREGKDVLMPSAQGLNHGHLAWAASALPLCYDNRTATSAHDPLYVEEKGMDMDDTVQLPQQRSDMVACMLAVESSQSVLFCLLW